MIKYKASGELIAHLRLNDKTSIVLIDRSGTYVVSNYNHGASEWQSGKYFEDFQEALTHFQSKCLNDSQAFYV